MPGADVTLREIDARLALSKGSAFRAFKRLAPELREGTDFDVLRAGHDDASIAALRAGGRIYAASVNVVVLSASAAERVVAALGRR